MTALCQGLGWFKRLALIGLLAALLRLLFGWLATRIWPTAEWAVLASAVMLLANLILLFWKKDFPPRTEKVISPWTAEFVQFLIVSAACVIGSNCFSQGDLLVANKFFPERNRCLWLRRIARARAANGCRPAAGRFVHAPFQPPASPRRRVAGTVEIARPLCFRPGFRRHRSFRVRKHFAWKFCTATPGSRRDDWPAFRHNGLRRLAAGAWHLGAGQPLDKNFVALWRARLRPTGWRCCGSENLRPHCCKPCPSPPGSRSAILFFIWLVTMRRHKTGTRQS